MRRPMRAPARISIGLATLLAATSLARAEEALVIAVFAPNGPFESPEARYSVGSKLAQLIEATAGVKAEPKGFARASDFDAAVKKNQIDFAVVDAVYLAERGVGMPVLAVATIGGETQTRWSLFASGPGGVMDLQGKEIALPATGSRDLQFVENALLDGELPKHFGARQVTPDIASAVSAVALKKAACVFAPDSMARGLRKIFDAGRVPNPAFVQVKSTIAPDLVAKVRRAVEAAGSVGPFDGWRSGSADPYRSLANRLGPKVRRPVMAEPEPVRLDDANPLVAPAIEPQLPEIKDQLWVPTGTP